MIENFKADIMMNSKGEFNGARVPRIIVEVGDRVITNEYSGNPSNPPWGRNNTQPQPNPPLSCGC